MDSEPTTPIDNCGEGPERLNHHVRFEDIITLYKTFKEGVNELKRGAYKPPTFTGVVHRTVSSVTSQAGNGNTPTMRSVGSYSKVRPASAGPAGNNANGSPRYFVKEGGAEGSPTGTRKRPAAVVGFAAQISDREPFGGEEVLRTSSGSDDGAPTTITGVATIHGVDGSTEDPYRSTPPPLGPFMKDSTQPLIELEGDLEKSNRSDKMSYDAEMMKSEVTSMSGSTQSDDEGYQQHGAVQLPKLLIPKDANSPNAKAAPNPNAQPPKHSNGSPGITASPSSAKLSSTTTNNTNTTGSPGTNAQGAPVFFSSGAGSTAGSPLRLTLQQGVQALKNFIKDVPALHTKSEDVVRNRLNFIGADSMRRIAKAMYDEKDAADYIRLSNALLTFCDHTLATCQEMAQPANSRANLKFFSSGGGTAVGPITLDLLGCGSPLLPPPMAGFVAIKDAEIGSNGSDGDTDYYKPNPGSSANNNNLGGDSFMASPRLDSSLNIIHRSMCNKRGGTGSPPPTPRVRAGSGLNVGAQSMSSVTSYASLRRLPTGQVDLEKLLDDLLRKDNLPELSAVMHIVGLAKDVLAAETSILSVPAPCVVVGDIHGQLTDLRRVIARGGKFGTTTYLFLGDYVDRGIASVHCMLILAVAKVLYPTQVFLLRGNHESKNINCMYGFLAEIEKKYPKTAEPGTARGSPRPVDILAAQNSNNVLFNHFNDMFRALPLAALVDDNIFCVHGGLSRFVDSMEGILCVDRFQEITDGTLADLTWSDPAKINNFQNNWRGSGCQFGADVTLEFIRRNNLRFICRAHQCVKEGYQWSHNNRLVTIFSATNYCGLGNIASIMMVSPQPRDDYGLGMSGSSGLAAALNASSSSDSDSVKPFNMSPREDNDNANSPPNKNGDKMEMTMVLSSSEQPKGAAAVGSNGRKLEPFDGIRFELLQLLSDGEGYDMPPANAKELPSHFQ